MTVKMWAWAQRMQADQAPLSEYCYPGYWDDRQAWSDGDTAGCAFKSRELAAEFAWITRSTTEKRWAHYQGMEAGMMFRRKEWQTATAAEKELWK